MVSLFGIIKIGNKKKKGISGLDFLKTEDIFKEKFSLPAMPVHIREMQEIIEKKDVDIDSLVSIIEKDPAIMSEVFKIANSAYYSIPKTDNLKYAVHFLGFQGIYPIVLSISAVTALEIDNKEHLSEYWRHSFETAQCIKKLLSVMETDIPLKSLWCPAIMHDIGKLVYLKFYPDQYKALVNYSKKKGVLFSEVEKKKGVLESGALGSLLCEEWKLPDPVKIATKCHKLNDVKINDDHTDLKRLIYAGSAFSETYSRELNPTMTEKIKTHVIEFLQISDTEYTELYKEIGDIIDGVEVL